MAARTVVLIGDVGMGKSTLVEKVTGAVGFSSHADESFTKASQVFETECRQLQLIDTPGANAMQDQFAHNIWIAHALNYAPVSLILIVVKADVRIDNTLEMIRKYAERFMDMSDIIGVCVTHMDLVTWACPRFLSCLNEELGFDTAVFSGKNVPGESILMNIRQHCKDPMDLRIGSENFLKYFKINNNHLKILKSVSGEVARFRMIKQYFDTLLARVVDFSDHIPASSRTKLSAWDRSDLVFEFQAWMTNQITQAQIRVGEANSFDFMGDTATVANQVGHIANLTTQLRAVLFEVRTMALAYQKDAQVSDARKCPHCGHVWASLEGCKGSTTCGNRVRFRDGSDTLATFCFVFDGKSLNITKSDSRQLMTRQRGASRGCGNKIVWTEMAPVSIPSEFRVTPTAKTDDIALVPQRGKRSFEQVYSTIEGNLGPVKKIHVEKKSFR